MSGRAGELLREFKGDDYAYGLGVLEKTGELTAQLGKRALFVGHIHSEWFKPWQERVLKSLKEAGVEIVDMARGVAPNAPFVDVYRLHSHIIHKKPDVIVVMGGGSSIDAVKCASCLAALGDVTPEIDPFFGLGQVTKLCKEHNRKVLPVVAIMTAASSAAHLTKYSNVTDIFAGQKMLIVDNAVTPPKAVFDYEITTSQPLSLTQDGALDSIGHLVEVYFGAGPEIEEKTRQICETGLDLIISGLLEAKDDPESDQARLKLGLGSDLGGYAIMVGGTSGPHLNSFSLVDVLSHGRACAVMNPYYTIFFAPAIEDKLRVVGEVYRKHGFVDQDLDKLSGRALGVAVARAMIGLSKAIGFPTRLKEVEGMTDEHIERCLGAAKKPQMDTKLRNMPVPLRTDMVDEFMGPVLKAAWDGDFQHIRNFTS
ncbi:iron-containing alcohol dehydrogenase [Dethiosulfatarculus sandiegensis]|uniref:Uncharacterized protein n=1 Tax=Dethiosulfatarculus sandiegensis TaxID=1429043 RepID=A0A0D2JCH5_9BACT|nr:iron-containing alcohol dehydrogenase [Dethiosulfatarculus sandiegensis]KIX13451.1 hypothetical protein X474_13280 [Dethiosulfatarculus sandiegensis]